MPMIFPFYGHNLLDRIHQKGYINNDALLVKDCVIVLESSVDIDPQDAGMHLKCLLRILSGEQQPCWCYDLP